MTIFTFLIEALKLIGEYSIKFSHILVSFVEVSTPIFLGIIEFLTKCVGGFYWLIYVLIRQPSNAPTVPRALLPSNKEPYYDRYNSRTTSRYLPKNKPKVSFPNRYS